MKDKSTEVVTPTSELEQYRPTLGRVLKSLWCEVFGNPLFSPYRQIWTVATNLEYAVNHPEKL